MLNLLAILFGGLFTLAAAYGLGAILLRKTAAPPEILLAVGVAAESLLVFLLLLCQAAWWPAFLGLGICCIAALKWRTPSVEPNPPAVQPLSSRARLVAGVIFAAYGIFYVVNGLAPEIQADGLTYHLGLPFEYLRLGGFPDHIRFYDLIPQGMEMVYTMAFAFGRHAAAKLVELGLFAAGVPLIFRIGRRLGMSDTASLVVAVFYWSAPVFGLTGSSTYNDVALVFFTLAAFYLLLVWRDTGETRYLAPAGVLTGFCYAIKFPGAFAAAAAMVFVLVSGRAALKGRFRHAVLLAAGMACAVAPWMIRAAVLTHNPLAPLRDSLFPNAYFHVRTDLELAEGMRSLHGVRPGSVPWELALGDHLMGTFGPMLYLLPLGFLAWRKPAARACLWGALILAVPWWSNTGARFLMSAVILAAFAVALMLPAKAAWVVIAVQALVCWPPLLNAWQPPYTFRLHELPWKAALGVESEPHYLANHTPDYNVAKMVEHFTPPDAAIYSLMPVANAYTARDVSVAWQSAEGDRLIDTLRMAARFKEDPLYNWTASWPAMGLRALRFRMAGSYDSEWDIDEIQLFSDNVRIFNSPNWSLRAWPNVWEAPLAFDNHRSTRWRTWQDVRRGMFLEVDLDHPQKLTSANMITHSVEYPCAVEFYGQGLDGKWSLLSNRPSMVQLPTEDLRLEATGVIRHAGYRYLLAPLGSDGNGPLGQLMMKQAPHWGLELMGVAGPNALFKLR
ncbi:MAG TPA: glycosyltransferase family 39 protein [Candidatus Sulfopaludibacter sp.]|nr:glycosyltransferase family 39 protein [Candidatus Sulfopaludibacter sp.]